MNTSSLLNSTSHVRMYFALNMKLNNKEVLQHLIYLYINHPLQLNARDKNILSMRKYVFSFKFLVILNDSFNGFRKTYPMYEILKLVIHIT